jgi:ribonuclease HII
MDEMATRILAAYYLLKQEEYPVVNFSSWDTLDDAKVSHEARHATMHLKCIQNNHTDVTADHDALVRQISAASIVLLKNTNGTLPLNKPRSLALIGTLSAHVFTIMSSEHVSRLRCWTTFSWAQWIHRCSSSSAFICWFAKAWLSQRGGLNGVLAMGWVGRLQSRPRISSLKLRSVGLRDCPVSVSHHRLRFHHYTKSLSLTSISQPLEAIQKRARKDRTSVTWSLDDWDLSIAASAARSAAVALVFISSDSGEQYITVDGNEGDRRNLTAWNNGDALVQAVAAANARTVVVVHSVGPLILEPCE